MFREIPLKDAGLFYRNLDKSSIVSMARSHFFVFDLTRFLDSSKFSPIPLSYSCFGSSDVSELNRL